jgi:hypothetical protein
MVTVRNFEGLYSHPATLVCRVIFLPESDFETGCCRFYLHFGSTGSLSPSAVVCSSSEFSFD